ncbi:MAG TPA: 2,3-diaminopropionate biosynthesis protein SbnA [Conexibacter sp.]|nr:2,3-diaminopropionate biosynthesis protein SbnA [Conexibacter sp.]
MVSASIIECIGGTPLVRLRRLFSHGPQVYGKLELLNPGGSVKDRPARYIIERGLRDGTIAPGATIVESSSGNFGIALAMAARIYELDFVCVVDPRIAPLNLRILDQLGARVEMVQRPDPYGGYLHTRLERVQELLAEIPGAYWIDQYANGLNARCHYDGIGTEIVEALGVEEPVDVFVAAVSTSATLMGAARRLRETWPDVRVVAVDAQGSVIFGAPASRRSLPGIGSSRTPELLCEEEVDEVIYVDDYDSARACRELLRGEGILAGGSSGSVIAAVQLLIPTLAPNARVVTVLPDRGERYMDLVYDDAWVEAHRPAAPDIPPDPAAPAPSVSRVALTSRR